MARDWAAAFLAACSRCTVIMLTRNSITTMARMAPKLVYSLLPIVMPNSLLAGLLAPVSAAAVRWARFLPARDTNWVTPLGPCSPGETHVQGRCQLAGAGYPWCPSSNPHVLPATYKGN